MRQERRQRSAPHLYGWLRPSGSCRCAGPAGFPSFAAAERPVSKLAALRHTKPESPARRRRNSARHRGKGEYLNAWWLKNQPSNHRLRHARAGENPAAWPTRRSAHRRHSRAGGNPVRPWVPRLSGDDEWVYHTRAHEKTAAPVRERPF
ncbi:protein of unknown function [Sterolibacterium denitrificans]|uniref:Uncharacterized protein n=1 Tax=Sterolibacterium denitrificans TaxID=157592 RepID=A0A7Z7MU82_9PROT|nr:protein of unknown function [Sterolibacterium denitrificans]